MTLERPASGVLHKLKHAFHEPRCPTILCVFARRRIAVVLRLR